MAVSRFPSAIAAAVSRSICREDEATDDEEGEHEAEDETVVEEELVGEAESGFFADVGGVMSCCIASLHSAVVTAEPDVLTSPSPSSSSSSNRRSSSWSRSRTAAEGLLSAPDAATCGAEDCSLDRASPSCVNFAEIKEEEEPEERSAGGRGGEKWGEAGELKSVLCFTDRRKNVCCNCICCCSCSLSISVSDRFSRPPFPTSDRAGIGSRTPYPSSRPGNPDAIAKHLSIKLTEERDGDN